jgi:hypothetical protein
MSNEGQHAIPDDSAVVGTEADLIRRTERQRLRALVSMAIEKSPLVANGCTHRWPPKVPNPG